MNSIVSFKCTNEGMGLAYYAGAMTLRADFADNLQRIRKARGLTQEELADRTGMSKGAIRAFEQRVNWPAWWSIVLCHRQLPTLVCGSCRKVL